MTIPWVDRLGNIYAFDSWDSPLGLLPGFCDEADERCARDQIAENYISGWHPASAKLKLEGYPDNPVLTYPEDPPLMWIATAKLHDEWLVFFETSWLAIVQPDGSYEIARID